MRPTALASRIRRRRLWAGDYWNGDIGHTLPFFTDAAVGTSLRVLLAAARQRRRDGQHDLLTNVWTLAANGTLTFSGSAPVPLPAALWLMFGALASVFGVSRKARGVSDVRIAPRLMDSQRKHHRVLTPLTLASGRRGRRLGSALQDAAGLHGDEKTNGFAK
jgi:hypothetical protein